MSLKSIVSHRVALLSTAAVLALTGCHSAPESLSDASFRSESVRAERSSDYWTAQENSPSLKARGQRIAITDFSVEFVTDKIESPGDEQPTASAPPIFPVIAVIEFSGMARKTFEYDRSIIDHLPQQLYDDFVSELQAEGHRVLSRESVRATHAYRQFNTSDYHQTSVGQQFSMEGSDTGRIRQLRTYPVPGLGIITGTKKGEPIDQVEANLLQETGADVALRVRVRVGVHRGNATVERGTTVWMTNDHETGHISANRSLLSSDSVVRSKEFEAVRGEVHSIHAASYLRAMEDLFPPFIAMAVESGFAP